MKLIMRTLLIHMVDATGQRVGEITVDEMELHLTLTLDLGRQGYRENVHQISGRGTLGFGVGQMDSKVPYVAASGRRAAGLGNSTDSTTIAFHFKVI